MIDTADWAEKLCTAALLARCKKSGIEEFGYGKGYVYLGEDFGKLLNLLEEVKAKGVNVVLTAHAKLSKFEQPDELGSYDRWELKLSKYILPMVKEWADLILFANYKTFAVASDDSGKKFKAQGGKRVMYTTHHPCWDAKNRYGLAEELPFEFEAIAALFGGSAPASAQALHVSAPVPKEMPQESPILSAATADPLPALAEKPQPAPAAQTALPGSPQYQEESRIQQQKLMANGVPEQLAQLMAANHISEQQVQNVVGNVRGYFPADMPIKDYPADFLQGVLIGAWPQVLDALVHYNTALHGALVNTNAYQYQEIILIDCDDPLFLEMIRTNDYAKKSIHQALISGSGRDWRIGPFKKDLYQTPSQDDVMEDILSSAQKLGVDVSIED